MEFSMLGMRKHPIGISTGEHLHFEVRPAGESVDPTVFVKYRMDQFFPSIRQI
jgi:hypothetical protein